MIQTIPSMRAVPPGDVDSSAVTSSSQLRVTTRAHAISIAPAQALATSPAGRTGAIGAFPLWLQPLDKAGAKLPRVCITGGGTYYFHDGIAAFWLEAGASVPSGTDAQYDVTIGTAPGDWLDPSAAAAGPEFVEQLVGTYAAGFNLNGTSVYVKRPSAAHRNFAFTGGALGSWTQGANGAVHRKEANSALWRRVNTVHSLPMGNPMNGDDVLIFACGPGLVAGSGPNNAGWIDPVPASADMALTFSAGIPNSEFRLYAKWW
jgi:hypothetical protein